MTADRWNELMRWYCEEELSAEEMAEGWHWCYDFDGLLVGPGMQELLYCDCEREDGSSYRMAQV